MTEYTTHTSTTTRQPMLAVSQEPVTGTNLLAAAYGGKVAFHKVRASGTMRRWPVLEPGTPARKEAEALEAKSSGKGGVAAAAKALNVSVATARRTLVALAFSRELEGLTAKDRAAVAKAAVANGKVEAAKAPKEQAPAKAEAPKEQAKPAAPAKPTRQGGSAAPDTKAVTTRRKGEPKSEAKPTRNTTRKAKASSKEA